MVECKVNIIDAFDLDWYPDMITMRTRNRLWDC